MGRREVRLTGHVETPRWRRWLAAHWLVVVAVGIVVAIGLARDFYPNLGQDEAFSLDAARRSLADTYHRALQFEMQPPVYFVLLKLWLIVSPTLVWARVLSTVAAVAAILVLDRLARLLGPDARILPLLAALSPTLLWAASTARGYALVLLLVAVSTHFAARLLIVGSDRPRRDAALYAVFAYLLLLTFYYGGFVLAGHAAAALLAGKRWRPFLVSVAVIALLFLPWLPTVRQQVAEHPVYVPAVVLGGGGLVARGWAAFHWMGHWLRAALLGDSEFVLRAGVAPAAATGLVLVGALRLRPGPGRWSRRESQLLLMAAVPFAALLVLRATNIALVEDRHAVVVTIGAVLFLTALLGGLRSAVARRVSAAAAILFLALSCLSYVRNPHYQDIRGVARYVEEHGARAEPVLFFTADFALPFREVFRGTNPLLGTPREMPAERWSFDAQAARSVAEVERSFASVAPPGSTFWLVMAVNDYRMNVLGGALVEQAVGRSTTVLDEKAFAGFKLRHLRSEAAPR